MKKFLIFCFFTLFISGCSLNVSDLNEGSQIVISEPALINEIAKSVEPAIVGINGIKNDTSSVGSGVCVTKNGYVLTNSHVVNDCDQIILYLSDKTTTMAEIVYEDTMLDFAILQSHKSLPYLALGDSDEIEVGQDVLAVGTPLSLTLIHTFTKGIVSATNRTLKVNSSSGEGYMQNLIQHDASLNPGNSGGPLINSKGEVIGINTLKISSGEGIGFAIPTKSFQSLLNSFVSEINYSIPYLGVYGLDNEIANFNGKSILTEGFYIIDIASNSPLKQIGIDKNSVITKINNKKISNTLDLRDELYKFKSNDIISIEFYKDGKFYNAKTKLV